MIEGKIFRFLENTNQRKWADPDLLRDLEFLTQTITENISEMSSWEAYRTEVSSSILEKSPVHYSERFWKENSHMFEKNKYEVLGMLVHILKDSQNTQNLEMACHDIGQFVRFHPMGRQ
jgi:V-type H+-transporting ATPase subunit H